MPTIDLPIQGMTCRACEVRITKSLTAVPGVARVKVSASRGLARIQTTTRVPRGKLTAAIQEAGYAVGRDDRAWVNPDLDVWRDAILTLAALLLVGLALRTSGLTGLTDQVGGLASSGGVIVIVLLGVAAGLSTCMAMVGGLVLAISARHAEQRPTGTTALGRLRPHLVFNAGRVLGFGVLGALVGALGSAFTLSGRLLAVLMIVVSLVMAAVGLQLTQLSPRLSRGSTLTLPARLSTALGLDRARTGYSDPATALLGAGTFFLPCGFTQAVSIYAMSTGSPLRAGVIMSLFALGTVPGLLSIGGVTAVVRGSFATGFFRFAGVAVLAFAALNISGALNVLTPGLFSAAAAPLAGADATLSSNVTLDGDVQVLHTTQGASGYQPASATVYAGREVRWEIDSVALSCATSLYAPELGLAPVTLKDGVNVLGFTPTQVGTLRYSCAMGMYNGSINVIAEPASPNA